MLARHARSSTEAKAAKDTKPAEESNSSAEAPKPKVTFETRLDQFLRTHCEWEDAPAKEEVKSAEVTKSAAPKRKGVLRRPEKTPAKEEVKSASVASVASRKRSRTRSISI